MSAQRRVCSLTGLHARSFSVCAQRHTGVLIYRSAHSLFSVCTEMGVLIYTPTAQCVCTETGNINLLTPLPTLFIVCIETRVLIKFTHHRPLDAQCVCVCMETGMLVYTPLPTLYSVHLHGDGRVNLQVCMPTHPAT